MSLSEQIQKDMYAAMKTGRKEVVVTLRTILSRLKDRQIANRAPLEKEEEIKVLRSLLKQRKESVKMFRQGGRDDLVQAEEAEIGILTNYLPKGMAAAEVRALVKKVIEDIGASSLSDIGKVMPEIMKRGKGLVDGKLAQQLVREFLG
ncbi:MAG: GatB/YqeY domain-containing protein [Fidelibacterota bacterium]